jgi:hypothetical protein
MLMDYIDFKGLMEDILADLKRIDHVYDELVGKYIEV